MLCLISYSWRRWKILIYLLTLKFGYSFMYIVIIPTYGNTPLARPTISFLVSHNCPGAYNPLSSTELLSPFVKNFTVPFSLNEWNSKRQLMMFIMITNGWCRKICILFMQFYDTMYDWYVSALHFEHNNITNTNRLLTEIG